MATKKITDLTLRSNFDATCNIPVDDSSQTWRTTGAQVLAFVREGFVVWAGNHDDAYSWTHTSTSKSDWTNATVGSLVETANEGFGAVATAASNLPGITFTPGSAAAIYLVIARIAAVDNTSGAYSYQYLTDGTTDFGTSIIPGDSSVGARTPLVTAIYVPGTVSPVTLKLMSKRSAGGGTTYMGGYTGMPAIEWILVRIR